MNYSYFGGEVPNQTLESLLEDVNPCPPVYQNSDTELRKSSRVYQNKSPSSGERCQHVPNCIHQKRTPIAGNAISDDETSSFSTQINKFSALHANPAKKTVL